MKKISVIISSLRPHKLEATIDSIGIHSDLCEVVVVGPYPPNTREYVTHVKIDDPKQGDPYQREAAGEPSLSQKMNMGLKAANGEYIVFHNDDLHFRKGWAPKLVEFMEKNKDKPRPYLASFISAVGGEIPNRYTVFGLLYANLGCIRKEDLKAVGGQIYDERMRTEYVDPDLSLRGWAKGGTVEICKDVVIDIDSYTRSDKNDKDPLCRSYKSYWLVPDAGAFFDIWFPKYFPLFFRKYGKVSKLFSNSDGVLPESLYGKGAFAVFGKYIIKLFIHTLSGNRKKAGEIKKDLARLVNRRWITLDYDAPYKREEIIRK